MHARARFGTRALSVAVDVPEQQQVAKWLALLGWIDFVPCHQLIH
jgi:hypothetical protein